MVISPQVEKWCLQGKGTIKHIPVGAAGLLSVHCPKGKILILLNVCWHYYLSAEGADTYDFITSRMQYQLSLIERGGKEKFLHHYRTPVTLVWNTDESKMKPGLAQDCHDTQTFIPFKNDIVIEIINSPSSDNWGTNVGTTVPDSQEPPIPLGQGNLTTVRNAVQDFGGVNEQYYPMTQFRRNSIPYTAGSGLRDILRFDVSAGRKDGSYDSVYSFKPFNYPIVELTLLELELTAMENLT